MWVHRVEGGAAVIEVAASVGWLLLWWWEWRRRRRRRRRRRGRREVEGRERKQQRVGGTRLRAALELVLDLDFLAAFFTLLPSLLYLAYYACLLERDHQQQQQQPGASSSSLGDTPQSWSAHPPSPPPLSLAVWGDVLYAVGSGFYLLAGLADEGLLAAPPWRCRRAQGAGVGFGAEGLPTASFCFFPRR
jgi:hypothetical protein